MGRVFRAVVALGLACSLPTALAGEDPPRPESTGQVDRILAEWHAKTSGRKTVEVRFRQETRSKLGTVETRAGRTILAAPGLGFLETSAVDAEGRTVAIEGRTIWNGRSVLTFDMASREAIRYADLRESSRLPAELRLPFFFDMTPDEARRDYDWTVLRDEGDRIMLAATRRMGTRPGWGRRETFLELSRPDFLPKRVAYRDEASGELVRFEATETRLDAFTDREGLESPCLDAWTVTEGKGRLLRPLLR